MFRKNGPLSKLINILQLDRKEISHIYVYAIFNGLLGLVLPLGIQSIITLLQTGKTSTSWYFIIFLVVFSIAASGILQLFQLRITENLQQKIFVRSSFDFILRFPQMAINALGSHYPPELANRFFDTLTIQKGIPKLLIDVPTAMLQIIFGLVLLSFYHPFFIAFSLFLLILLYFTIRFTALKGLETSLEESKYKYKAAHWIQEAARAMTTFKVLGKNDYHVKRNDLYVQNYLRAKESHFKVLWKQFIQLIGFKVVIALSLLLIGGLLVINQQMNIGQFIASEIIILLIMNSVEKIILNLATIYDVLTAIEKISAISGIPLDEESLTVCKSLRDREDIRISTKGLYFNSPYINRSLLKDISLNIQSGRHFAIVGNSESSSHALIRILQGMIVPDKGVLSMNDIPYINLDIRDVQEHSGSIQQEDRIFYGTLIDNITLGRKDISVERVMEVCNRLGLSQLINELSQGLKTYLLSDGKFISEADQKRILVARATIHSPRFIFADDSLEYFCHHAHRDILDYLFSKDQSWTIVSATRSNELIQRFDEIALLNGDDLVATGDLKQVCSSNSLNDFCYA